MATRIRSQRHGRKSYVFYFIVIADNGAPCDDKLTEKIGVYNPNTSPATADSSLERALHWVLIDARPSGTVHSIFSHEGAHMKKYLLGGVAKGAFGEAEAEARSEAWESSKQSGLAVLKIKEDKAKKVDEKTRLEAEKEVNEAKVKTLTGEKVAEEVAKAAVEAPAEEATPAEEAVIEAAAE